MSQSFEQKFFKKNRNSTLTIALDIRYTLTFK